MRKRRTAAIYLWRFVNDPLEDPLVNAKVITKGERLVVITTTNIYDGDEMFITYGAHHCLD